VVSLGTGAQNRPLAYDHVKDWGQLQWRDRSLTSPSRGSGYRGFWTGIRRQRLSLLVNGVLSGLKHGGRFGYMRNPTRT
jgi:hypothetical protein